ncbi:cysteine peptidase family C39 domain-containing protein [Mucilaginibacter sp. KACC 22773]|uniref:cysteine peptidase family C39 domain-containing protein n=1 Tax=Mucilaginibacter sp. KACC 22773 TaxID=3025671 RepID=UPI0023658822|nr:cysteine peptidase family C39 domain-containing protein [Mucilaginibacter sp. KACC 22773]WDF80738.1 cysteine peptidase family C39 domain-containing protein [Mucilaginibacter sp. KACC 22773]
MLFPFTTQNADKVVYRLLKKIAVNISPSTISAELEKHPDYPSLLSISDVLNNFGVENVAYRMDPTLLTEVSCPFIAHTNRINAFVVVNEIDKGRVNFSDENKASYSISLEDFKKLFNGVILTVTTTVNAANRGKYIKASAALEPFRFLFAIGGLMFIFILGIVFHTRFFLNIGWPAVTLTLFKTAGLITALLLLIQSIDSNNPLVQRFCGSTGDKVNCNSILSSKAANVFKGLSWSELGFFYFAGTWLLLLFGNGTPLMWRTLAIFNFISLPYTFYSIYYQARIAKQWCVLCCIVQSVLWLEFSVLVTTFGKTMSLALTWKELSDILIYSSLPIILWMLIKPVVLKAQQVKPLKGLLRRFKYNIELFDSILAAQPKYALPGEEWSILLGNTDANNIITMVSNPYCQPCARAHQALEELLAQRGDVQARIIFTASNHDRDIRTPIVRHLMALNRLADRKLVKHALNDWYDQKQKDYATWAKIYPVQIDKADYHILDRQAAWCGTAEITETPTMLVNGHKMPDLYQLSDLKYMLE